MERFSESEKTELWDRFEAGESGLSYLGVCHGLVGTWPRPGPHDD